MSNWLIGFPLPCLRICQPTSKRSFSYSNGWLLNLNVEFKAVEILNADSNLMRIKKWLPYIERMNS